MVFSSLFFIYLFLPLVLGGYYIVGRRFRNYFLLCASLVFYYIGEEKNIWIMIVIIIINYVIGLFMNVTISLGIKRVELFIAVIVNLGFLIYYKYLNFGVDTINSIMGTNYEVKKIILPIGISFFIFQALTYVIDLYVTQTESSIKAVGGGITVQKNPFKLALYVSFFPQLIAGPIVRYTDIEKQIDERKHSLSKFVNGIERFSVGLAKKVIIANGVGKISDAIFGISYYNNAIITCWIGVVCYTLQIYFDFSGYSDMAIGLGKMFGFDFKENFDLPYIAKSISEFWRRWHISLSSFFRDYVYIPLGGNRTGNVYINLFIVFLLTGIWHGASWNFIIWGIWNGALVIIERIVNTHCRKIKIPTLCLRLYSGLAIMIGWVFFRAETVAYALGYIKRMLGLNECAALYYYPRYYLNPYNVFIILIAIFLALGFQNRIADKICFVGIKAKMIIKRITILLLFVLSGIYLMNESYNPFIYFRF